MDAHIINPPPVEERDQSLGQYMDSWSRLETGLRFVAAEILQIDGDAAHVIWSAIQTSQSIKVLEAAAKLKLTEDGQKKVSKICEKIMRRNIRRNFIVHGSWRLRIVMDAYGRASNEQWERVYDHIDPYKSLDDEGSRFTIQELDKTTAHVEDVILEMWSLAEDIPSLRVQPQPL